MNVKKLVRETINKALREVGFELRPFRPDADFSLSPELRAIRDDRVSATICEALRGTWLNSDLAAINQAVVEFSDLMQDPPLRQVMGGAGYANGVLLFVIARLLSPPVIVESGVFRGFSTWVLHKAAPSAALHCFDVDFSHLEYRCPQASYYSHDWTKAKIALPPQSFGFFDDHTNQAQRIIEAAERGLKRLVFDDDIPLSAPYADIPLIVPTVSMTLDDDVVGLDSLTWRVGNRNFAARIDHNQVEGARAAIAEYIPLPALTSETRFSSSPYSAVRLQ